MNKIKLVDRITIDANTSSVVCSCSYQIRKICSICSSLATEVALTLVHAFVSCRLNYNCNSVMHGTTKGIIQKIQSIMNSAARLIPSAHRFDRVTQFYALHCLPFSFYIVYKFALVTFSYLHQSEPIYLTEMPIPVNTRSKSLTTSLCPTW